MTAVAPAVGRTRPAAVPWRRLTWVAWRQHRAALAALVAVGGVIAVAMAVTGLVLHSYGTRMFSVGPNSPWRLYYATQTVLVPVLLLIPVLAGMFLGAPLVAREYEAGTTRFAWCQAAGRVRLVLAALAPATLLLAIVAAGLGLEHRWWLTSVAASNQAWEPGQFSLSPLPFVGWTVFGLAWACPSAR